MSFPLPKMPAVWLPGPSLTTILSALHRVPNARDALSAFGFLMGAAVNGRRLKITVSVTLDDADPSTHDPHVEAAMTLTVNSAGEPGLALDDIKADLVPRMPRMMGGQP